MKECVNKESPTIYEDDLIRRKELSATEAESNYKLTESSKLLLLKNRIEDNVRFAFQSKKSDYSIEIEL